MGNKNTKFNDQTSTSKFDSPNANGHYIKNSTSFPNANMQYENNRKHSNGNNQYSTKSLNRNSNSKYNYINNSPSTLLHPQSHQHYFNDNAIKTNNIPNLTASPLTLRQNQFLQKQRAGETINFNQAMKAKQNDLTNAMKTIDSNQPSYQMGSKLYKPHSFLSANNGVNSSNEKSKLQHSVNQNHSHNGNLVTPKKNINNSQKKKQASLTSSSSSKSSSLNSDSPPLTQNSRKTIVNSNLAVNKALDVTQAPRSPFKNVKISPEPIRSSKINTGISFTSSSNRKYNSVEEKDHSITNSNNKNSFKTSNTKLNKRFGLSPGFKRKIVETIKHGVQTSLNSHHNQNNGERESNQKFNQSSIFSNSRLFQALQSQWNLFSSIRLSKNNFNDENELFHKKTKTNHRTETQATFLSTSLQHNSFRYASRRKYKTQSLANPYRHANTNYPVYIHEALFMPEFSVKGQVTEADFEIMDVISRGAFGHVIKVKKKNVEVGDGETSEQIYAMKIMWKSQVIRDRALQQVKDEVTIAINCVDNPLIVKTWFYWQSKRFLYIITDYVENGELLSLWLKVHHFPERLVIIYAVEMCLILDYLHRRGIIYRDIKMENILLDQRGHVQLIDFGLSKWVKMGDRTGTICGTIQYMAPEILGVEPYDHSVDWWSLGILIYALLSGEYPLNAAKDHIQMNERVSKHIFELDRTRGSYTDEACELVRKLLRKNPNRRLKSLDEIKREPFFIKEVNNFVNNYLKEEKLHEKLKARQKNKPKIMNDESDTDSDDIDVDEEYDDKIIDGSTLENTEDLIRKKAMISENFWNPYVIMQSYSPLQLLFDEIYALKQKQLLKKAEIKTSTQKKTQPSDVVCENRDKKESKAFSLPPSPSLPQLNQGDLIEIQSNLDQNNSFTKF